MKEISIRRLHFSIRMAAAGAPGFLTRSSPMIAEVARVGEGHRRARRVLWEWVTLAAASRRTQWGSVASTRFVKYLPLGALLPLRSSAS